MVWCCSCPSVERELKNSRSPKLSRTTEQKFVRKTLIHRRICSPGNPILSTDITGRRKDALDTAVSTHGKALAHPKGRMIPVVADITDKAALAALVQEVSKSERHVDVLVNNAGVSLASSTVEKGDESAQALQKELWAEDQKDWEDTYKTNVIG